MNEKAKITYDAALVTLNKIKAAIPKKATPPLKKRKCLPTRGKKPGQPLLTILGTGS